MSPRPRVLLVGPLPIDGDVVGGTKVSFAALARRLESEESLDVEVHDISRKRAGRGRVRRLVGELYTLARLLLRIALLGSRPDVVFLNASSGGLLASGPLLVLACRLRGARCVVRAFGGDLDLFMDRASRFTRWLFRRTVARADLLLLQTRMLCDAFGAGSGGAVCWWPTTRDLSALDAPQLGGSRRFLFLGQLRREKGVEEAIEAARALPSGATLTIAGPPMPGYDLDRSQLPASCRHLGAVPPGEVAGVLAEHDVLVFPTYHEGEGMPGIVIEAMQAGLPVIATDWRAVPELVEDGRNGLLVAPRDPSGLGRAMLRLAADDALLGRLREGARETGERFRSGAWEPTLVEWLHAIVGGDRPSPSGPEEAADPEHDLERAPALGCDRSREPAERF